MDLERQASSKPGKSSAFHGLLVGGLIGATIAALALAIGPFIGSEFGDNRLVLKIAEANEVKTPWDLLAFPFLMLIVLGTHEIGHLIGGLSQGMRFLLLIVGPFGWHASVAGPRFEWNTNVALMGGLAATLPTEVGASLRRQLLVMIAGGPLASLLLAIFAVAAIAYVEPRLAAYCLIVAATSFGIFLVTLIPTRAGGFMSDGMQLIDVWRGGSAVVERSALLRIIAHYRALLESSVDGYPSGFRQSVHVELAIGAWLAGETDAVRRPPDAGGRQGRHRREVPQASRTGRPRPAGRTRGRLRTGPSARTQGPRQGIRCRATEADRRPARDVGAKDLLIEETRPACSRTKAQGLMRSLDRTKWLFSAGFGTAAPGVQASA